MAGCGSAAGDWRMSDPFCALPALAACPATWSMCQRTRSCWYNVTSTTSAQAAAWRANAAAALVVTRPGPAVSPSRTELDAFLAADGRFRPTP